MAGLKLTKINNASYYRNEKQGFLLDESGTTIQKIIEDRLNKKSPKLIKQPSSPEKLFEVLEKFVDYLNDGIAFDIKNFEELEVTDEKIRKLLTKKGKNKNLIYYIKAAIAGEELNLLKEQFQNQEKENKKRISKKIEKSILNNKIRYIYDEDLKIYPSTKRGKIYSELLKNIAEKKELQKFVEECLDRIFNNFSAVSDKECDFSSIRNLNKTESNKVIFLLAQNIRNQKNVIFSHFKELRDKNIENEIKLIEIENDLKKHLLILELLIQYIERIKNKRKKNDLEKLKELLEKEKIKKNITGILHNKLTNYAIDGGKLLHYKLIKDEYKEISSEKLQKIKIEETYNKKYTSSISLIWNTFSKMFSEITGVDVSKDLLGASKLPDNLNIIQEKGEKELLNRFNIEKIEKEKLKSYFEDIHKVLSKVRHSRIHFQKEHEIEIINIENFKKSLMKNIENFKPELLEKFKHNGVFHAYKVTEIEKILKNLHFTFEPQTKKYPSFDKILKRLLGRQKLYDNRTIDSLIKRLDNFDLSKDLEAREKLTKKFLLQYLYKYAFQKENIEEKFFSYVEEFKKYNEIKGKKNIGYTPIYEISTKDFSEYFKELQRLLIIEQTKENSKNENNSDTAREDYVQRYREDIFGFIFYKFLENNIEIVKIINNYKIDLGITNEALDEKKETILKRDIKYNIINFDFIDEKKIDTSLIESYIYYSFLDAKTLSELSQEIQKYVQVIDKNKIKDIKEYITSVKLISLMLLTKDRYSKIENINSISDENHEIFSLIFSEEIYDSQKRKFKEKYENILLKEQLYIQGTKDIKEWILYHNLEKLKEYSLNNYLKKILKLSNNSYKIIPADIEEYLKLKKIYKQTTETKETYIDVKGLHDELLPYKIKNLKPDEINKKAINYKINIEQKNKFENLKNKLEFVDLKKMVEVSNEIIARGLSYIQKFERDVYFVKLYLESLEGSGRARLEEISKEQYDDSNGKFFKNALKKDKQLKFLMHIEGNPNKCEVRNDLAHFDLVKTDKNLINTINNLKDLMAYDKKILNAIPLVIKEILREKIGIEIEFIYDTQNMDGKSNLKLNKICSLKNKYLKFMKNESFEIEKNSKEFVDLIEILFK